MKLKIAIVFCLSLNIFSIVKQTIRNFEMNPAGTFIGIDITRKGRYFFEETVNPNPASNNMTGIKISTSDVYLNLNSYSLEHVRSGGGKNFIGIEVAAGLSNITITGGFINNIDGCGIKIGSGCKSITISNLEIIGCTEIGIDAPNLTAGVLENVYVKNIVNTSTTTDLFGVKIETANNCHLNNVCAKTVTSGKDAYGIYLTSATSNNLKECKAEQCTTAAGNAYGFYSSAGTGNQYKECSANGNKGANITGKEGSGFYFTGELNTVVLDGSTKDNTGKIGYGMHIVSSTFCTFENNKIFTNTGTEEGYGIKDEASSSVNFYLKNLAYANQDSTTNCKVNNYYAKLAPDNVVTKFPVISVFLNDYKRALKASKIDNIEVLGRPDGCNE